MKQFSFLICLCFLLSCNNAAVNEQSATDTVSMDPGNWDEVRFPERGQLTSKDQFYVWEVDPEKKTMKKNPLLMAPSLGIDTLIQGLNDRYPQILLEKKRVSNDTLYAEIKNASYLTEQMGSYGAEQYIAYTVLNLTAAPGVRYVRLDFAEGSHAAPDVWSRESFAAYSVVED